MPPFSAPAADAALQVLPKPLPSPPERFFRVVGLHHALVSAANVTTGEHSGYAGGRYNPPRSEPVCYLGGTHTGSAFEVEQEQFLLGLSGAAAPPRVAVCITVEGGVWLDLTNPTVSTYLNLAQDQTDLFMPSPAWKALNQRGVTAPLQLLGASARAAGFHGVRFPAIINQYIGPTLPGLHNLALFMDPARPTLPESPSITLAVHHNGLLPP